MSDNSSSRVVLVTGAGGPIGRATALAFAELGDTVIGADWDAARLEQTANLMGNSVGDARMAAIDVSDESAVAELVSTIVSDHGRLDVAFNNAGISGPDGTIDEYATEDWQRVLDVDLTSVFLCMKYEIRQMRRQSGGVIVNTSSSLGMVGQYTLPAYVAAKHGVLGLTRAAALDHSAEGIRVNAVLPGMVSPGMIDSTIAAHPEKVEALLDAAPIGRFGRPEEIASAVVWLASPGASFVSGAAIALDGGYLAK